MMKKHGKTIKQNNLNTTNMRGISSYQGTTTTTGSCNLSLLSYYQQKLPLVLLLLLCCNSNFYSSINALDNGVALLPPMGWLSWERYGCNIDCSNYPNTCISSKLYLEQGNELVNGGYRDVGYVYVNIDDCWSLLERNNNTNELQEDPIRFPNGGLTSLSKQLHSLQLKFGLYTDIGSKTCGGYPGLNGDSSNGTNIYFTIDANTFATKYKIDSIKVDGCNANSSYFNSTFPSFGDALNKTGRPIVYNCKWSVTLNSDTSQYNYNNSSNNNNDKIFLVSKYCNMYRNYYDITDNFNSIRNVINYWSIHTTVFQHSTGVGYYNDGDMLLIGNNGLSYNQQYIQMCMWCIFTLPLYISTNLVTINNISKSILLNIDLITINQDSLVKQGYCVQGCPTTTVSVTSYLQQQQQQQQQQQRNLPMPIDDKGFSQYRIYIKELTPTKNHQQLMSSCYKRAAATSRKLRYQQQSEIHSSSQQDYYYYYSDIWVIAFLNLYDLFGPISIVFDIYKHLPNEVSSITKGFILVRDIIHQQSFVNKTVFAQNISISVDDNSIEMYKIQLLFKC